jgi:phenylpropionate dioxygenase-like ring-hydroxylating dioxygenase large terminal subunit
MPELALYDATAATLDRAAFSDPAIHALELRRIFASAWLFVGPANLLANPGDVLTTRMGDRPVLFWRDGKSAKIAGALLDAERTPIANIAHHRGLVFACLDEDALPLPEWFGPFAADLDAGGGTLEAVGGGSLPWGFAGNWKLAAERFCGDIENGRCVHAATNGALGSAAPRTCTLFPNLSFDAATSSLHVWHPVAPDRTEVETYGVVASDASAATRDAARRSTQFAFGPAGLQSQDLVVAWQSITATSKGMLARRVPLTLAAAGEAKQRAFYGRWQNWLHAANERPARRSLLRLARAGA